MGSSSARLPRVLVIDDDAVMRELLEALLGAQGYEVQTAESGEAALEYLNSGAVAEVILADMQLPGISGVMLAAELRAHAPQSRLIGMSGTEPAADVQAAYDRFLLKPFSPEEFAEVAAQGPDEVPVAAGSTLRSDVSEAAPLDTAIYGRMAGTLPFAQLRELYRMTLNDISARLARMAEANAAGDLLAYRQDAHALKGGCSMVGAAELATFAARAEVCAATGTFRNTPSVAEFQRAFERLSAALPASFRQNE